MLKRGWKTPLLEEVYTKDMRHGSHHGQTGVECTASAIRVRSADNCEQFLSYAEIMDTMLHELAHFKYDSHCEGFWALLLEL